MKHKIKVKKVVLDNASFQDLVSKIETLEQEKSKAVEELEEYKFLIETFFEKLKKIGVEVSQEALLKKDSELLLIVNALTDGCTIMHR